MKGVIETLESVVELLDRHNLPYAVMGGIAVRAYAIPRATYDVDLTIAIDRSQLPELFAALKELDFAIPEPYESSWVDRIAGMPLLKLKRYYESGTLDVDLFLEESEFQKEVMKRRVQIDAEGRKYWMVTPEDLILFKLIANRPRDHVDISDVLFMQGQLDEAYMRSWSKVLEVESKLEQALSAEYRNYGQ
jgi:predicted nucleotidyltransferase